jgi:hypothetical protein
VTSLKFLRFLKYILETPYVVSYFFNRPAKAEWELASGDQKASEKETASIGLAKMQLSGHSFPITTTSGRHKSRTVKINSF